jgi:hypothetical protein
VLVRFSATVLRFVSRVKGSIYFTKGEFVNSEDEELTMSNRFAAILTLVLLIMTDWMSYVVLGEMVPEYVPILAIVAVPIEAVGFGVWIYFGFQHPGHFFHRKEAEAKRVADEKRAAELASQLVV